MVVGLVIRLKIVETPLFRQLEHRAEKKKVPIAEVFTRYPRTWLLNVKAVGASLAIVAIWFASRLSDKYGRRAVMLTG